MWSKIKKTFKKEPSYPTPPSYPDIPESPDILNNSLPETPQTRADEEFLKNEIPPEFPLAYALFQLRRDIGEDVMYSKSLINALDDYKAFRESKPSQAILRAIISDGIFAEFIAISEDVNFSNKIIHFVNRINRKYGFVEKIIERLLWEILLGVSKCKPEDIILSLYSSEPETPIPGSSTTESGEPLPTIPSVINILPPDGILPSSPLSLPEKDDLKPIVEKLSWILSSFNINPNDILPIPGPKMSIYEVDIENKQISKIVRNEKNILNALGIPGSRMINPLPHKLALGFEIPNGQLSLNTLSIGHIINSDDFKGSEFQLPVALGLDGFGKPIVKDLAKVGNLLIAGNSQCGKTSLIRSIIVSLLVNSADKVKFLIAADNPLEFLDLGSLPRFFFCSGAGCFPEIYEERISFRVNLPGIYHEVLNRKAKLKAVGVSSLEEYNNLIKEGKLNFNDGHIFLPHIICIVDEKKTFFGSDEFPETHVEEGNLVGVHFIFATKYSDAATLNSNVLNKLPNRIAFKHVVPSESKRIILNDNALNLLPQGDAFIFENGIITGRFSTATTEPSDVKPLLDFLSRSPFPVDHYIFAEKECTNTSGGAGSGERDALYEDIKQYVIISGVASTSNIQRVFNLGYNRVGRIMDQLEEEGIVGPSQGGKSRAVLVTR